MINYINNYIDNFHKYKGGIWCYEDGVLTFAVWKLFQKTNNKKYLDFVDNYYDSIIDDEGNMNGYKLEEYNIDNILGGVTLIDIYLYNQKPKYLLACHQLYKQLLEHPRTDCGSFWHKKRYPYQIWMDGIFMGQIFLAKYTQMMNIDSGKSDVLKQLNNMRVFLFDDEKQLYVHAYDEKKVMQWANPINGHSPHVWSRACGWVSMALVELMEIYPDEESIKTIYIEMIKGLLPHLKDGMWSQIVNYQLIDGNYLETSGSAMIGFSIMKAIRLGILSQDYQHFGEEVYESIIRHYYHDGSLGGICKVAGLDNERRNGSFEYYMSEEIAINEVKGIAPFIALYSEMK